MKLARRAPHGRAVRVSLDSRDTLNDCYPGRCPQFGRAGGRKDPKATFEYGRFGEEPLPLCGNQAAIVRGEISLDMALAFALSATRRSYEDCRFSQPCASLPK